MTATQMAARGIVDMTQEMTEAEEAKMIAELIEHDKSLTDAQRSDARFAERMRLYRKQLWRQLEHTLTHVPSRLLARQAHHNYRVACALWPEDMAHVLRDDFMELVMRESNRCRACQNELPMPYDGREHCSKCEAEFEIIANDMESL